MGSVTAVDVIVAVVLLGLGGVSLLRGFVHQVLSIGAWVGAVFVTFRGFDLARPFFRSHIGSALGADIAAGASLFLVSLLILSVITKSISDRVRRSSLNSVDSSLGFVFGVILGAALLSLAYSLVTWVVAPDPLPDWLAQAKTRPWLERGANLIRSMAPAGFGAAENATKDAAGQARDLKEAEETFRKAVSPAPSQPDGGTDTKTSGGKNSSAYDQESRSQMNRLIQTTNQ